MKKDDRPFARERNPGADVDGPNENAAGGDRREEWFAKTFARVRTFLEEWYS